MGKWIKIFSTQTPYRAEIVKDILENNGLSPIMLNKKEFVSQTGVYEVLITNGELLRAKKILEDEVNFE